MFQIDDPKLVKQMTGSYLLLIPWHDEPPQLQKANPINRSNEIYLITSKSTHHPTNKKAHD